MENNIVLPSKINVGYQERGGTYTGKLAYIIYWDAKGKLRKETSWNSWKDKDIETAIFDNEPLSGFVLNKKAGGCSTGWNYRQPYVRIYDPRGFEFEITIENLLYILANTNSIKGKGLEGEFIYGWEGTELMLIPTNAPDYKELSEFNDVLKEAKVFKGKDMIPGATYLTKDNFKFVYLGRFLEHNGMDAPKKKYFFYNLDPKRKWYNDDSFFDAYTIVPNLTTKIIDIVDEECHETFPEYMTKLKDWDNYTERDIKKDEYVLFDLESFKKDTLKDNYGYFYYFSSIVNGKVKRHRMEKYRESYFSSNQVDDENDENTLYTVDGDYYTCNPIRYTSTLAEIFLKYEPVYLVTYNSNGEKIKEFRNE